VSRVGLSEFRIQLARSECGKGGMVQEVSARLRALCRFSSQSSAHRRRFWAQGWAQLGSLFAITTASFLNPKDSSSDRPNRPSLTSIPGVGKSALTIQFIQSHVSDVSSHPHLPSRPRPRARSIHSHSSLAPSRRHYFPNEPSFLSLEFNADTWSSAVRRRVSAWSGLIICLGIRYPRDCGDCIC
jgi:hypothetical protein